MPEEKILVNGVDMTRAVAKAFVVGDEVKLSDGRVVEVRAGKVKFRDALKIGEALGPDATPTETSLALACTRLRFKTGASGAIPRPLMPEDVLDLELEDANALLEAALGKKLLSPPTPTSPRSSGPDGKHDTSKG